MGTLLLTASATAEARGRSGDDALEPVAVDLDTLYCRAEGEWCPPIGEPGPMTPTRVSEVGYAPPTPKEQAVRAELSMNTPELTDLQPVVLDSAAVICYSEGTWCGLLPTDQQPVFEPGI